MNKLWPDCACKRRELKKLRERMQAMEKRIELLEEACTAVEPEPTEA